MSADGFAATMRSRLPEGMTLPTEIADLFGWIETQGFVHPSQRVAGDRFGTLMPLDSEEPGTIILFRVESETEAEDFIRPWFGKQADPGLARRLVCFARTGSEGSQAAFWLDDSGRQHIVHLGSEGDNVCTLGGSPLDFLRLLAIGYSELIEGLSEPDTQPDDWEEANPAFRNWLATTFDTTVPRKAGEIVRPTSSDAPTSDDPFWNWVQAQIR